ncbi:hypothetical protein G7Z17_g7633 [Cylindrodendrum hubeiense]|uniref:PNPLA domain-containing protein n=1 Tax=Cylindrodendrum hubeiense TaxID=595255 RepID=A0A9P5H802_9HYPO|nr:hypothetical protein G7Z17_g7633 [Cylindrodendrum hubeiense]
MHHSEKSPRRQFPIRSLIYQGQNSDTIENLEAPVPGARTGASACLPTTGEVNLYLDPDTFGTQVPYFFADCEGMLGGEPVAAQYQKRWFKHGRRYLVRPKDGKQIDRQTAVMTIYPRFLYIFSDVICMVTRNQKAWADSVVKLLEWSRVGAHNTVNQYALPALVIVLNGPTFENSAWISGDHEAATRDFFMAIEQEINKNTALRKMAKQHGDKTMNELLTRNFSSVYVHYIPLEGFENLGNSGVIIPQIARLAHRIRSEAKSVQKMRAETWSLFDARQLSMIFDFAFKHLASGSEDPFDFNQCRQQISPPTAVEGHFAEFMRNCLKDSETRNFDATASIVGSCIVRNSMKLEGSDLLYPSVVFNKELKEVCRRALDRFLSRTQSCSYIRPETGEKCVNTKIGHAKGHQSADGVFFADGNFISGVFNVRRFLELVGESVVKALKDINRSVESNREARRAYAAKKHRELLASIPDKTFWTKPVNTSWMDLFNGLYAEDLGSRLNVRARVCYACLFGRPEYAFPCGHIICFDCVREFDQTAPKETYPGTAMHKGCVLCGSQENKFGTWPYFVDYRPDLSGIRLLSLDGGGVRGIIQLSIIARLDRFINLDIPFGELFDLIVGTSAGGLIALGLGTHNFSVEECITHFKSLCEKGFQHEPGSKNKYWGWVVRLFVRSIYKTEPLENALKSIFGQNELFGHRGNASRVAVITTVSTESRLLANYNGGDGNRYMNSTIYTWLAARCTSAAPMYFEPAQHCGTECRDGGLTENNPVQVAVNEARTIWGPNAAFDLIASLGCGEALEPQGQPVEILVLPSWLKSLFSTLIATMNGNSAWDKFSKSVGQNVLDRCSRLNVHFWQTREPKLDDVTAIKMMERLVTSSKFPYQHPLGQFSPVLDSAEEDGLKVLGHRLMASLYFFELKSITQNDEVSIVKGWICFNKEKVDVRKLQGDERLRLEHQWLSNDVEKIRAAEPDSSDEEVSFMEDQKERIYYLYALLQANMSGIEALGLACNIFQVISFGREVIDIAKRLYRDGSLDESLAEHSVFLDNISSHIQAVEILGNNAKKHEKDLVQIAEKCKIASRDLREEIVFILGQSAKGSLARTLKVAAKTTWRKRRLDRLEKDLSNAEKLMHSGLLTRICDKIVTIDLEQTTNNEDIKHFIQQYHAGYRSATDLVTRESQMTREHASAEAKRLEQHVSKESQRSEMALKQHSLAVTNMQANQLSRKLAGIELERDLELKRERLLGSLKFPNMNERRNGFKDAHPKTFQWLFSEDSVSLYSSESDDQSDGQASDSNFSNDLKELARDYDALNHDRIDLNNESEVESDTWHTIPGSDEDTYEASSSYLSDNDTDSYNGNRPEPIWDTFPDWLRSDAKLYWISGKPGSGKSTLVNFILSEPRTVTFLQLWQPNPVLISHFFWRPGTQMQQSIKGMLCTILYQILFNSRISQELIINEIPLTEKDSDTDWSIKQLLTVIGLVISKYERSICMFIDGLDEIHPSDGVVQLLSVVDLFSQHGNVKICLSSRPEPLILKRLQIHPQLRIQDLTKSDLESYARDNLGTSLQRDTGFSDETVRKLLNRIVSKAEGVFLWLCLAIKDVSRGIDYGDSIEEIETYPFFVNKQQRFSVLS